MTPAAVDAAGPRVSAVKLPPAVVFVVAACVAVSALRGPYLVGVFHDDGVYALLAREIANGNGFHYANLPGHPAAAHYPPFYPLLLAALWRIGPDFPANVPVLVGFNALLLATAAVGFWYAGTRLARWRSEVAAAAACVCTLTLPTLTLAGALLSETLFLAALWPSLMLSQRALDSGSRATMIEAGVAIGMLMLVRTHAAALLAALCLVLAFRRQLANAALVACMAAMVQVPWLVYSAMATPHVARPLEGSYGSYLGWFLAGAREGGLSFLWATMRHNTIECWLYFGDRFAAGLPAPLTLATQAIALAVLGAGVVAAWRRLPLLALFLGLYMAIVLVWPYTPWRFIWGIWPLIGFTALLGVDGIWRSSSPWRTAALAAAALPAITMLRVETHAYATREWRTAASDGARQVAPVLAWVHAHVPPASVVLTEGEQVVTLYEGHEAAPPVSFTALEYLKPLSPVEGARRLDDMLRAVPARYVILFNPAMIGSAALVRAMHPVESLPGGVVFEVAR